MTVVAARNLIRWVLAAMGALFLAVKALDASEFRPLERAAQIRGSDLIAVEKVIALRSAWNPDGSLIVTDADIALDEVWEGEPASDRVTVRTLGGSVAGVAVERLAWRLP